MTRVYTIPSKEELSELAEVPEYMRPSHVPHAVVAQGVLNPGVCNAIIDEMMKEEPYSFTSCSGVTREATRPLHSVLEPIRVHATTVNASYFGFDLNVNSAAAWFQTYTAGTDYEIHMDGSPGQSRKITTVALLSDEDDYVGGVLEVILYPNFVKIPRTRGTLVTFPSWILHRVTKVDSGIRQTINLGLWGPPFQ